MICGIMRVKNEQRWIAKAIRSIAGLCAPIVVLDDHSEDDTAQIAFECGAVVLPSPFEGLDETRDKNYLLQQTVKEFSPQWILCLDGDEELADGDQHRIWAAVSSGHSDAYSLRIKYLWDSPEQCRTDGVYGRFFRPSLWRVRPGQTFKSTGNGGNFHCGNVPQGMRAVMSQATLNHYGYMFKEDRLKKFHWYNERDPGNTFEDFYQHIVIGDLYAADSRFKHAGPLKLEPIECPRQATSISA